MTKTNEDVEKKQNNGEKKSDGEKEVIDYLLKEYRSMFRRCVRQYKVKAAGPMKLTDFDKNFMAEQLDMISCVCEFLAKYETYRLDKNVHSRTKQRWEFRPSNQAYNKTKAYLRGPIEVARKKVKAKAEAEAAINQDKVKAKKKWGEDDPIVDMQLVLAQVSVFIDRYSQFSPYIKNEKYGVGSELFDVLNRYRRDCDEAHNNYPFRYDLYNPPTEEKAEETRET